MGLVVEFRPARQRRENDTLGLREGTPARRLATTPCLAFGCAVEPGAFERLAREQRVGTVDAGPLLGTFDQALLDRVAEEVGEPLLLGFGLVRHRDGAITPRPELLP